MMTHCFYPITVREKRDTLPLTSLQKNMDRLFNQLNVSSQSQQQPTQFMSYLPAGANGEPNPQNESIIQANASIAAAQTQMLTNVAQLMDVQDDRVRIELERREAELVSEKGVITATQSTIEKLAIARAAEALIEQTRELRESEAALEEEQLEYADDARKRKRASELDTVLEETEHEFTLTQARHEAAMDTRAQTIQIRNDGWNMEQREREALFDHDDEVLEAEAQRAYDVRQRRLEIESQLKTNEMRRQQAELNYREKKRRRQFDLKRQEEFLQEKIIRLRNSAVIDEMGYEIRQEKKIRGLRDSQVWHETRLNAFGTTE